MTEYFWKACVKISVLGFLFRTNPSNVLKFSTFNTENILEKYICFFILVFSTVLFPQDFVVKSLVAYTTDSKTSIPVVAGGNKLIIEFDVQGDFIPNMNMVFRFCDTDWKPTNNIFLLNQSHSVYYSLDFENLPITVIDDAKYHFKGNFPDSKGDVEFPFSGKWRFYITDTQDTSIVYGQGRFFVVKEDFPISVKVKRDQLEDKSYWPTELAKVFNVTTDFNLPANFHPAFVDRVEIIDDHLVDYPVIVDRNMNDLGRQFKWDADRKFTFIARDIQAGNEYRQADLRDHNLFPGPDVKAQRDGIENSRFYKNPTYNDLNGGLLYSDFKDDFSTYLNVTFSVRPPEEIQSDVFLVGAFNNWKLSPENKMENIGGVHTTTIHLKRGIYDYQYVVADLVGNEIQNADWQILEGNTWNHSKEFHVFLYYKEQKDGGYDRIVGYAKVVTK